MNLPGDQKLWLYSLAVMAEEDRELPLAELANLPAAGIKITIKPNIDEIFRRFVRNDFGKKKLINIKYSDILQYYLHLINEEKLAIATVDNIHTLLHPTFQMAVRNDIIRKNPTDGVMTEITYNADERLNAAREGRKPMLLPEFSCHHLRHTFATRLCEVESNLRVIQSIMGHKNIETTMDVYAEATDRKKEETFENLAAKLDELF
ncbi:MAG: tyrosine-type recombinase/integrase [Eubacterium sp.]|jgi:integrase|nr:tyrosine-type recombinase/integrase [Eubacterium sp.]